MSRIPLAALAVSAFVMCSGWSLFGSSDDSKDAKKPQTPVAQTQPVQPAAQQTQQPSIVLPPVSVDAEIGKARVLREQGKYDEATKALGQLMLADPDDARVVGEYGKALAQQGSSKDAVAFLTRATQLNSTDWSLFSALGVSYDQSDDHKAARVAYDRALALKPGEPTVLNNYAVSLMLSGDLAGAERMLDQAKSAGASNAKVASNLDMLSSMKATKAVPTASTPEKHAATTTVANAPAAPKPAAVDPKTVVMQQVPVDDHAGPVATQASREPRKLMIPSSPKPKTDLAAKPAAKSKAPVLRTADQGGQ